MAKHKTVKKNSIKTYHKKAKKRKHHKSKNKDNWLEINERLTDNEKSIRKILFGEGSRKKNINSNSTVMCTKNRCKKSKKCEIDNKKEPEYISQFDLQKLDMDGLPSAPNDTNGIHKIGDKHKLADLERQISYQGGWSSYGKDNSMTYGVIPDDQLTHNNMMPSFNKRYGYGTNDFHNESVMNYKNELFTGNNKTTWQKKKEVGSFFSPTMSMKNIYGMPVRTNELINRYTSSNFRQNELPFEPIKITPGLNLDYHENGTHGLHPTYRPMEKTIDELRVKPKITLEGRMVEGMHGQKRPLQAPVISYKPITYKITTENDLIPTTDSVDRPKVRDNFLLKEPERASQLFEYTGGAYTKEESIDKNVPENMREKYKCSTRQTFSLPQPLQKFSVEGIFNPNLNSYDLPSTHKDQNIVYDHLGLVNGNGSYINQTNPLHITTKETISNNSTIHSAITHNTMRGTVHDVNMINPTLKETNNHQHIAGIINPDTSMPIYHPDLIRPTMKESIGTSVLSTNPSMNINIYARPNDIINPTTKETILNSSFNSLIELPNKGPIIQDITRQPIGEISSSGLGIINQEHYSHLVHPIVSTETTNKELIEQSDKLSINPPNYNDQRQPVMPEFIRQTSKENTANLSSSVINPLKYCQKNYNSEPMVTSIKEINEEPTQMIIQTCIQNHITSPNDAKTTNKEINLSSNHFTLQPNIFQLPVDSLNSHCITNKETILAPQQTVLQSGISHQPIGPTDPSRSTTREIQNTLGIQFKTITDSKFGQTISSTNPTNLTNKETILSPNHSTRIIQLFSNTSQPIKPNISTQTTNKEIHITAKKRDHNIGRGFDIGQKALPVNPSEIRTTLNETIDASSQTFFQSDKLSGYVSQDDPARVTSKEIVPSQLHSIILPLNQTNRTMTSDVTRSSSKEITVQTPWDTFICSDKILPMSYPSDVPNYTLKEINEPTEQFSNFSSHLNTIVHNQYPIKETGKDINESKIQFPNISSHLNTRVHQQDPTKVTGKEIIEQTSHSIISPFNHHSQPVINHQNTTDTTSKEIGEQISLPSYLTLHSKQKIGPQEPLDITGKETINQTSHYTITPDNQHSRTALDYNQIPSTKMKEINKQYQHGNIQSPDNIHNLPIRRNNLVETTLKETIEQSSHNTIAPINQHAQSAFDNTRITDATMKEINEQHKRENIPLFDNSHNLPTGRSDSTKISLKEFNGNIKRNLSANTKSFRQPVYSDIIRNTSKENLIKLPTSSIISNYSKLTIPYQNLNSTTLKETINPISPMNLHNIEGNVVYQDIPSKTTGRETTISIPYQKFQIADTVHIEKSRNTDNLPTTFKEIISSNFNKSNLTPIALNASQVPIILQPATKSTIKETSLYIPFQGQISDYQKNQTKMSDPNTTTKEIVIHHSFTYHPNSNQHKTKGDAFNYTPLDTTLKDELIQTPLPVSIMTDITKQAVQPSTKSKVTIKELHNTKSRITNPNSNIYKIKGDAFNYIPLDSTLKDELIQTPLPLSIGTNVTKQAIQPSTTSKITIKELGNTKSKIMNPNINQYKIKGDAFNYNHLPSTLKDELIQTPLPVSIVTDVTKPAIQASTISKITTKELHETNSRITNPHSEQCRVKGDAFNYIPFESTLKDELIQIPLPVSVMTNITKQAIQPSTSKITAKELHNTNLRITNPYSNINGPIIPSSTSMETTTKELSIVIPYQSILQGNIKSPISPQDITRTTNKEITSDNFNNGHISGQLISAIPACSTNTFDMIPTKTTDRETTSVITRDIGNISNDITGKGYGYLAANLTAPTTQRETISQEMYLFPIKGDIKMKSYDTYHGKINDNKEQLLQTREPTTCNVTLTPSSDNMMARLRNDNNRSYHPMMGYSVNNTLDRPNFVISTKSHQTIPSERFIDPILLQQLKQNPYHLDITRY